MRRPPIQASLAALCLAGALAGCDLAPTYERPTPAAPTEWPQGAAYGPQTTGPAGLPWRALVGDERLRQVIDLALAGNQDLRAALANVALARAQYRVQRSYQLPTLAGSAGASITSGGTAGPALSDLYDVDVGISSFEVDLFGRMKNQTKAALQAYLATESGMHAARLTLVAETATAYATLASDQSLLEVAQDTAASGQRSLDLTRSLLQAGLASAADEQNAITVVEQAKADLAKDTSQAAQDRNALDLLAGAPVPENLLPTGLAALDRGIAVTPAGLSSTVLLGRPDVVGAEYQLKSAYAVIGTARAGFFPVITLTSAAGVASSGLSALFTHRALDWSAAPSATMPLVGGPAGGNLQYAESQRDYDLAAYEKAVQAAFRDVADGLARRGTIVQQRQAQAQLTVAAAKAYDLADAQYRVGAGSYLNALVAQRTLYAARQAEVAVVLADVANRITLYEAIGADDSLDEPRANPSDRANQAAKKRGPQE